MIEELSLNQTLILTLITLIISTATLKNNFTVYFAQQTHIAVTANRAVIDWRPPFFVLFWIDFDTAMILFFLKLFFECFF
jgi:hypothetical protein